MLNSTEIELIYAVLSDTAMNLNNNNQHHLSTEIQQLAGRFLEEYTTDDSELEYQDMLNHSRCDVEQ